MVVEARLFYKKAVRFDDELTLRTEAGGLKRASLRFEYVLSRDGDVVSTGYTRHGCIELSSGRPVRIPGELFADT